MGRVGSVFVQTADDYVVPVTLYTQSVAIISRDPRGGYVIAYGSVFDPDSVHLTFDLIADLAAGELPPSNVDQVAANLRTGKHVDPVRGVIAAYLYKSKADIDSIRRMAYFYGREGQAVPFDIALLGELPIKSLEDGRHVAHVPGVRSRESVGKDLPWWAVQATPEASVEVGGTVPWLSVGWDYVSDPPPDAKSLVERIQPFRHNIVRSGFTNFPASAASDLCEHLGLQVVAGPRAFE